MEIIWKKKEILNYVTLIYQEQNLNITSPKKKERAAIKYDLHSRGRLILL